MRMSPEEIEDRETAHAYLREADIHPSFSVASGMHPGVMFIYLGLIWEDDGVCCVLQWNNPPDDQRDRLIAVHHSHLTRWKGYDNESP